MVRSVVKVLLLIAVLSGVVAMHQLPMAQHGHQETVAVAVDGPSGHGCCGETDPGGGIMLHLCLAVTVAAMALGALRLLGRVTDVRRYLCAGSVTLGSATLRAPPWLRPCLYSLRVLRL